MGGSRITTMGARVRDRISLTSGQEQGEPRLLCFSLGLRDAARMVQIVSAFGQANIG